MLIITTIPTFLTQNKCITFTRWGQLVGRKHCLKQQSVYALRLSCLNASMTAVWDVYLQNVKHCVRKEQPKTDRQAGRQTGRQAGRQTGRHTSEIA